MLHTAWTVKAPSWAWPPYHIQDWHAFRTREKAIDCIGSIHRNEEQTNKEGWRKAYRKGWRIVKCNVIEVE